MQVDNLNTSSISLNTPLMRQYLEIKAQYPNEILFFRMGDFYEMFLDDAVYASKVMNIVLTKRADDVPMCGLPYHSWSKYIYKILQSGKNIAICEQLEDPKTATGKIVKRGVVRIITPGSIFEEELLEEKQQNCIASIIPTENESYLIAIVDLSTCQIILEKSKSLDIHNHILCHNIKEFIIPTSFPPNNLVELGTVSRQMRNYETNTKNIHRILATAFSTNNINILEFSYEEQIVLLYVLSYANEIAPNVNFQWNMPEKQYIKTVMALDESVLKTLEILNNQDGTLHGSLLSILDKTQTTGGYRLLHRTLTAPLLNVMELNLYYDTVDFFLENKSLRLQLLKYLKHIKDISRLLHYLKNTPQVCHIGSIYYTLKAVYDIIETLSVYKDKVSSILSTHWFSRDFPNELFLFLQKGLYLENLPPLLDERRCIQVGYSNELDGYFKLSESAQEVLLEFETSEKEKYNISSLKIRYNKVIGYYIEVSKGQADRVPKHYIRRQTLTTGERYSIQELNDLENRILNAKDLVVSLQKTIFKEFTEQIFQFSTELRTWEKRISLLDMLLSFAEVAEAYNYVRPIFVDNGSLILTKSRHPVVESLFKTEVFTPNDVHLNQTNRHLAILTGPNMAGKSTYIRQVGLIQIMAQIGSFVPAESAHLSIVDRIFTRIGAYDRLFKGESTFFVEMLECAHIFRHYTGSSLILLDEVGRGTSTFDGMSIAKAMIAYLNTYTIVKPKVLFATHFAELANMIDSTKGIFGLTVEIAEMNDKIIFLRRIIEGVANKSYGVYVAYLAGLPKEIIDDAKIYLDELENSIEQIHSIKPIVIPPSSTKKEKVKIEQQDLF